MKRIAALTAVALLACAGNALAQMEAEKPKQETKAAPKAQAATLKVGDAAPALAIAKWVKGDQITGFEKGRVYVVEFWATWCGPCIASMPHLSELQKEYKSKGVTIIGVTNKDPNNSLEDVEKMVTDKGDTMGYTVAWDDEGKTNQAYMKAARQRGIPTAFVVDQKSNIAYIGHPSMLDPVMGRVVDGNWDYVEGPKELKKIMDRKAEIYEKSEDEPAAALKLLESFEKEHPKLASDMGMMKYAMQNRTKDAAAAKTGAALVDAYVAKKDAMGLNELAWTIVDPDGDFTPKDLDLAMRAASEAVRLTKNEDGAILDTLARVYHLKGDNKKAIEIQTQAISKAKGEMKEQLEKTLDEYKNAKN